MFSKRLDGLPESFIRRLLSQAHGEDFISLAGGHPMASLFPVEGLNKAVHRVTQKYGTRCWQYGKTEGEYGLREQICQMYANCGLEYDVDNILVTTGSQQALDLIAKAFINPGDFVLCEDPGYLGAIQVFKLFQAQLLGVSLDEDGPELDLMNAALERTKPQFFYCTPIFQNPSNIIYSQHRAKDVAQILTKKSLTTVIDDPYSEIYFEEKPEHILAQHLSSELRIMLGTFSKIISPGFRLGWIAGPVNIIKQLAKIKQASDLHSTVFGQLSIQEFIAQGSLPDHLVSLRNGYKAKAEVMHGALTEYAGNKLDFQKPKGGMFFWGKTKSNISTVDLYEQVVKKNVAYVPGTAFQINQDLYRYMRLNYTFASDDEIVEGIRRIFCEL